MPVQWGVENATQTQSGNPTISYEGQVYSFNPTDTIANAVGHVVSQEGISKAFNVLDSNGTLIPTESGNEQIGSRRLVIVTKDSGGFESSFDSEDEDEVDI